MQFCFIPDTKECIYLSKYPVEYSALWTLCSYGQPCRLDVGTGFLVIERHKSFSWQRKWLCARQSLKYSNMSFPLLSYKYLIFASAFCFAGWMMEEEIADQPQLCKHNWGSNVKGEGDASLVQALITAHQAEGSLKMDVENVDLKLRDNKGLWGTRQGIALQPQYRWVSRARREWVGFLSLLSMPVSWKLLVFNAWMRFVFITLQGLVYALHDYRKTELGYRDCLKVVKWMYDCERFRNCIPEEA